MTAFVELLVAGLSLGTVYALIALGFAVIYKSTETVNFAHGAFLLAGGLTVAQLHAVIGFPLAVLCGIAVSAVLALLVERVFVRPLRRASHISLAILTFGLNILVTTEVIREIGTDVKDLGGPWGANVVKIGMIAVPESRIWAGAISLVVLLGFFALSRWSSWGIAMRAAAEDPEAATLVGVRLSVVSSAAWAIAGVLAAIACIFVASFPSPGLDTTTGNVAFTAFAAAIIGGLDSTHGAVLGGLAIGVIQTLTAGYQDQLLFLGRGFADVMPYVVMLLVLLVRPSGFLGTREVHRV